MAQPVSRDAGGGDGALLLSLAAIVVGLGAGGWYLWQEQHAVISAIVMQILHGQMRVIHLFTNRYELADTQVLAANPAKVTAVQLLQLAREVGRFFLVPAIALVLGLAVICFRRAAPMRFSRRLDLDGLLREQARVFRSPAAFVSRRLGLVEIREGEPRPADLALNASEWIARWAADKNGGFNESLARKELGRQLGDVWRGLDHAAPHIRCLLAVFALHGTGQRGAALKLLGDLSDSLAKGGKEGAAGPTFTARLPGCPCREGGQAACGPRSARGHSENNGAARLYDAGADERLDRSAEPRRGPGSRAICLSEACRPAALVRASLAWLSRIRGWAASKSACGGDRSAGSLGGGMRPWRGFAVPVD